MRIDHVGEPVDESPFAPASGANPVPGSRSLEVRLRGFAQRLEQALGDGIVQRLGKRVHGLERARVMGSASAS